jgi:hypothetical protein
MKRDRVGREIYKQVGRAMVVVVETRKTNGGSDRLNARVLVLVCLLAFYCVLPLVFSRAFSASFRSFTCRQVPKHSPPRPRRKRDLPNLVENLFHDVRNETGFCFPIPNRLAKLVEFALQKNRNFQIFPHFLVSKATKYVQ